MSICKTDKLQHVIAHNTIVEHGKHEFLLLGTCINRGINVTH
jgi:hypothetical protein